MQVHLPWGNSSTAAGNSTGAARAGCPVGSILRGISAHPKRVKSEMRSSLARLPRETLLEFRVLARLAESFGAGRGFHISAELPVGPGCTDRKSRVRAVLAARQSEDETMSALARRLWIGVGAALVLTAVLVFVSGRGATAQVAVADVVRENLSSMVSSNGKVEPVSPASFRAGFPAFVERVYAVEGQQVKRGQIAVFAGRHGNARATGRGARRTGVRGRSVARGKSRRAGGPTGEGGGGPGKSEGVAGSIAPR